MANYNHKITETNIVVGEVRFSYVHVFETPFQWEGKEYESLTFDFNSLRGKDVLAIAQELRMSGIVVVSKTFDVDYQYRYAARCCREKIGADLLLGLPVLMPATMVILAELLDKGREAIWEIGRTAYQFTQQAWNAETAAERLITLCREYAAAGTIQPFPDGICSVSRILPGYENLPEPDRSGRKEEIGFESFHRDSGT